MKNVHWPCHFSFPWRRYQCYRRSWYCHYHGETLRKAGRGEKSLTPFASLMTPFKSFPAAFALLFNFLARRTLRFHLRVAPSLPRERKFWPISLRARARPGIDKLFSYRGCFFGKRWEEAGSCRSFVESEFPWVRKENGIEGCCRFVRGVYNRYEMIRKFSNVKSKERNKLNKLSIPSN